MPAEKIEAISPSALPEDPPSRVTGFRTRLFVVIMLVVASTTALALYFTGRNLAASVEADLELEFQGELLVRHNVQQARHAALVERCRALVRRSRIQAALEDDALDLLYLNAEDELRDIMATKTTGPEEAAQWLHATFYRFIDRHGRVITPPNALAVGTLTADEEAQLTLPGAPERQQVGYLVRQNGSVHVTEIITMPIFSTETGEVIAALALGYKPFAFGARARSGMRSGIWVNGIMDAPELTGSAEAALAAGQSTPEDRAARVSIGGAPHLVFSKRLNPDSSYPPAYEVCVYPLGELAVRQRQLRWQVLGMGGLFLLVGLAVSHFASSRLSAPVEKLAVDSEENRAQRRRAEAALEMTSAELQRSARFSADASHQLKTPVTVLRAGLEELLTRENLTPAECHEISALIHQTYRLSSLIEDLLLLSRLDAGRLKLEVTTVDLTQLIEASLDDLSALPDELHVTLDTDFPAGLRIAGEKRYTAIILQNLLENARKYNRPGGRIRIAARAEAGAVLLTVGNTGRPITPGAQDHIFERFHRGAMGENVPGYGLGLNLARELARLHGGDLHLLRSDAEWTEFEVRFRAA
jgi:signal transduction histidine kinase